MVRKALDLLLYGHDYAEDLQVTPWEFPVDIATLAKTGCTLNDLRWLTEKGYAEQAGSKAQSNRGRRPPGNNHAFRTGTRFVLTDLGVSVARLLRCSAEPVPGSPVPADGQLQGSSETPVWIGSKGELHFRDQVIKQFRKAVSDQRSLLDAFQDRGWPEQMADPLPRPGPGVNAKKRLQQAINNLNRGLKSAGLRFFCADAGRTVGWRRR